jgi:hypothetical protein
MWEIARRISHIPTAKSHKKLNEQKGTYNTPTTGAATARQ